MTEVYVEQDCTITHEGQTFEAGGAVVTPNAIVAYLGRDGNLVDWHGKRLGSYRIVKSWKVWSYMGTTMNQVEARVGEVLYTGRSSGEGCIYRGRRKARKS